MNKYNYRFLAKVFLSLIYLNAPSVSASALKDVKETRLVIEGLNEKHANCGITKSMLDAAVRLPISNSRLNLTERATTGFIYVNVNAFPFQNMCAASVELAFTKYIASQEDVGRFWSAETLMIWNKNEIGRRVTNELEGYTKELIAEWLKVNAR